MDLSVLASTPGLGIVVPPANPTIEPEMARLVPFTARIFTARLPVMPGTTLEERNRAYIDCYQGAVAAFGTLQLRAMLIGLTGPSYRLGPDGDAQLSEALSAVAGIPVETASGAIRSALKAIGAKRLCLFSPYPAWLTDEAASYWAKAGYEVCQVVKVSETFRAYELSAQEVDEALRKVTFGSIDAVVMSGTGMLTLPALLSHAENGRAPLLSSNICSAYWLMQRAGIKPGEVFQQAAPALAATF